MAEVFASASAAIGIAAAAGQLIDGITKLSAFCSEVRDIPDDIQNAVEHLSILVEVLDSVEVEIGQNIFPQTLNHITSGKVLASLKQSSRHVGEVLREMEESVGKKKWGRIQAVQMKGKLEKSVLRVQNAQNLLLMTLVTDSRALLRRGLDDQQQGFAAISGLIRTVPRNRQVITEAKEGCLVTVDLGSPGTTKEDTKAEDLVISKFIERTSRAISPKSWTLRLMFPKWFLGQVWDFNVRQANRGWDFGLRSYHLLPENADLFSAITDADLPRVRQMLSSGEASIWDRDPDGLTVLHYAASNCCYSDDAAALFEFLMYSGADINACTFHGWPIHTKLPHYHWIAGDSSKELRLVKSYRLFITNPNWVIPRPTAEAGYLSPRSKSDMFSLYLSPPPEVVRLALNETWPPWDERPLSDRLETLFPSDHSYETGVSPLSVRPCLGYESFRNSFAQCDTDSQIALVYYTLGSLAHELARGLHEGAKEARYMLKDMFSTGILWQIFEFNFEGSPMQMFAGSYVTSQPTDDWGHGGRISLITDVRLRKQEDLLQKGLKCYVAEMLLLGIDVVSLVGLERKKLEMQRLQPESPTSAVHIIYDYYHEPHLKFRVIGFDYGPSVDEWRLWLSNPLDEWAADFWDMIDHPERAIPGAWVDE